MVEESGGVGENNKEKTQTPEEQAHVHMTHWLHITPPDAILKIVLSSTVGIIYLDSCYSTHTRVHM